MNLSKQDKRRFYNTMTPLLHYVNQQKSIVEEFPDTWNEKSPADIEDVAAIREELWQDKGLIEAFVRENPANLSQQDLDLAASWKHFVDGQFYILKHLKNYSVFLDDDAAYGVHGISESIEDMIHKSYLPLVLKTVLIPFEGRIIYDGIFIPYPVLIGPGITSSLNDTYRRIQEREGIITDLTATPDETILAQKIEASNKKILRAFEKAMGKSGLSAKKMLEHKGNIESFADDFMLKKSPPAYLLDISVEDIESYLKSKTKVHRVSFKRFVRFLRDSYRIDYYDAENLLDALA